MARPFRSVFVCHRCSGRLTHAFTAIDEHGRMFCNPRCRRKQIRDERKELRHKTRRENELVLVSS